MSDPQFAALFAIAQSAPGPNVMIVTLIGWKLAGLAGALIATLAMCGPSGVLVFFGVKLWDRAKDAPWRAWVSAGLTADDRGAGFGERLASLAGSGS